jgi:hypothetical protein
MFAEKPKSRFEKGDRLFLGAILAIAFVVGLRGIAHHGYIGQDFDGIEGHHYLIRMFPEGYSYRLTNPPGLYWLGNLVFRHLSTFYYLEVLAVIFLTINLAGLGLLFGVIWEMIALRPLRFAAAGLIAFVPFRTIHAVVIAADAFTVPFFALAVVLTLQLFKNPRSLPAWFGLSAGLSLAVACKYTFVGLLVPVAVVLGIRLLRSLAAGERRHWITVAVLALALPAGVFMLEMRESAKLAGSTTSGHWKAREAPSEMRWQDMLTLQKSDVGIFSAPHYFRDEVYGYRKFSYGALLHLSAFTDIQNLFQPPPLKISSHLGQRAHGGFLRERTGRSQLLAQWSVAWCVPFTILAIVGTLGCGLLALHALFFPGSADLSPATVVAAALAAGFYAPVFFSLPHVGDPYTAGYWLPRLVMPALVIFLTLGFTFIDLAFRKSPRRGTVVGRVCLVHAGVACALFIGFLF